MGIATFYVRPGEPSVWSDPDLLASTGAGAVLADESDATFLTSHFDEDPDDPRFGIWAATLEPTVPSWILDQLDTGVFWGARANHEGSPVVTPPAFLRLGTSADGPNLSSGMDPFISTTIDDYGNQLFDGVQLDFATLVNGTAVVFFGSGLSDGTAFGPAENLYEFVIAVTYSTPDVLPRPPVCRIHPRDDELGAGSAARIWPPSRSQQSSNRRAGGYY